MNKNVVPLLYLVCVFISAAVLMGCRTPLSNDDATRSKAEISIFGMRAGPLQVLEANSQTARQSLAEQLKTQFSQLLRDTAADSRAMRIQVQALIDALQNGAHSLCLPKERVKLFRGQGIGLNFKSQAGSYFVASDAVLQRVGYPFEYVEPMSGVPVRFSGDSWEDRARNSRGSSRSFSVAELIENFASAQTHNSKTGRAFGFSLDPTSFEALAARHVSGASGSPFLSYSALPDVASMFGPPFHIIEVCPARVGVSSKSVPYEREGLILAFTLPEETVSLSGVEFAAYQRLLAGQQVNQITLDSGQMNWLAEELQKARTSFEANQIPYFPRSAWSQCLAGVPAAIQSLTGKQSSVASRVYEQSREVVATKWPELPATETCGCRASVEKANEQLAEGNKFDANQLCGNEP